MRRGKLNWKRIKGRPLVIKGTLQIFIFKQKGSRLGEFYAFDLRFKLELYDKLL